MVESLLTVESSPPLHRRRTLGANAVAWCLGGLAMVFYYCTASANLSETDDVYAFAYRAEEFPIDRISDPRLMLYHALMRVVYLTSEALGFDCSALSLMRAVSMVSAGICLAIVFRILRDEFRLSGHATTCGVVTLACSYGFWRYAAEAEVYVPAMMLVAWVYWLIARGDDAPGGSRRPIVIGGLAGLAVLFYQPNVIPLFFAFPIIYGLKRHYWQGLTYVISGASLTLVGYWIGFLIASRSAYPVDGFVEFLTQRSEEFDVAPLSVRTIVISLGRSVFSFGHDLFSANWAFGFAPFVRFVHWAFPYNLITEEVYAARYGGASQSVAIAAALLAIVATGVLGWFAIRLMKHDPKRVLARIRESRVIVTFLWFVVLAVVIGRLNAAGIEAWIVALLPFSILLSVFVYETCVVHGARLAVSAFVAALVIHNLFGGMAYVRNAAGEMERAQAAWVVEHASGEDLVIVLQQADLAETIRYLGDAKVVSVDSEDAGDVARLVLGDDVIHRVPLTIGRDFSGESLQELIRQRRLLGARVVFFESLLEGDQRNLPITKPDMDALARLRRSAQRVDDSPELEATYVHPLLGADGTQSLGREDDIVRSRGNAIQSFRQVTQQQR